MQLFETVHEVERVGVEERELFLDGNREIASVVELLARKRELLAGRVALVTGVSRRAGIGFAIARRLLELGAAVFAQSWRAHDEEQPWGADDLDAVLDELRAHGRVEHVEADFADPDAPARVVAAARGPHGPGHPPGGDHP